MLEHLCRGLEIEKIFWVRCNLEYQHNLLFPQHAEVASAWLKQVQNEVQKQYFRKQDLDLILVGRRTRDGNDPGEEGMDIDEHGVKRYAPIYDWSHKDVLGYMEYFDIDWPPFYFWTNGFQVGTGPWAAREYTGSMRMVSRKFMMRLNQKS